MLILRTYKLTKWIIEHESCFFQALTRGRERRGRFAFAMKDTEAIDYPNFLDQTVHSFCFSIENGHFLMLSLYQKFILDSPKFYFNMAIYFLLCPFISVKPTANYSLFYTYLLCFPYEFIDLGKPQKKFFF